MSWPLPIIFCAWGFRNGGAIWQNASQLAYQCNQAGIRSVAVQLGLNETGDKNTLLEDAQTLRNAGLMVAVWGVAHAGQVLTELERLDAAEQDWLPQIEGVSQRDLVIDAATNSDLYASAIVTNYSGAGDGAGEVDWLRDCGVETVLVECYNDLYDQPYQDLERMLGQGEAYGWDPDELVPVMGTYRGQFPNDFTGTEGIGRNWGLYLAEPMVQSQWDAFGQFNPAPPPTPEPEDEMEPVTDQQARDTIVFAAQASMQNYTDDKPRGRVTVCRRIANSGNEDDKWNMCRDTIVQALDDAGVPD